MGSWKPSHARLTSFPFFTRITYVCSSRYSQGKCGLPQTSAGVSQDNSEDTMEKSGLNASTVWRVSK